MRFDNKTLFGVPFETGVDGDQYYVALHEVTMRDAHADGEILKRVGAHTIDYHIRMVRQDTGEEVELSLSGLVEIAREESDVDAVETLDRITSEQQIGVKIKKERESRPIPEGRDPQEASPWELKDVTHRKLKTHSVDFHHTTPPKRVDGPEPYAKDINRLEKELRKECAGLASEIAYALLADGRPALPLPLYSASLLESGRFAPLVSLPLPLPLIKPSSTSTSLDGRPGCPRPRRSPARSRSQ